MISAVIVNYNSGQYLQACIKTVVEQVDEIIIVDNDSTDNSISMIKELLKEHPSIHLIMNELNLGFATACNIGLNKSKGDSVAFLNPDCIFTPTAIPILETALRVDASIGMVGGLLMNPDGSEQHGGRRAMPTPWRSFVNAFGLTRFSKRWPKLFADFNLHHDELPETAIEVEAISGACMLVKREAIESVGQWDEDYFLHCEDLDLCMSFVQKGWKVMFVPEAKISHVQGVCGRSRPVFVEWHKHQGMIHFYKKFFRYQYPGVLMWLVVASVWVRFLAVATPHFIRHFFSYCRKI
ncbi:MAG: glycosyltransferase [Methylococcaceae bacterium]|nr:glycosyltransferase [Methylococcaceae bacterium]